MLRFPAVRPLLAGLAGLTLAGCAGMPATVDEAEAVSRLTQPHTGQVLTATPLAADTVDALLQRPLSRDVALQLALQNSPDLQGRLAGLGVTAAEVEAAGQWPNPGFRFSRLTRGDEIEWERGWHFNLAKLLTRPLVRQVEARRLEVARRALAIEVLARAAEAQRAWVMAVAADESLAYRRQVLDAAEAGAELARRMQAAGNFNALAQAREQNFAAEARLGFARAQAQQLAARERLARLLGLTSAQTARLQLPDRLPPLPDDAMRSVDIETRALTQRLDVQAARAALEQAARQTALARTTRWVSMLELGVVSNSASGAPVQRGWAVALELPLFGNGPLPRAEALAREASHAAAATALRAASEAREAYGHYLQAYEIARQHRDEGLPLAQRISREQLRRYNAMLIGVFDLLADARAQIAATSAAQDALRDFWLAQVDLDRALLGPTQASALTGVLAGTTSPAIPPANASAAVDAGH